MTNKTLKPISASNIKRNFHYFNTIKKECNDE